MSERAQKAVTYMAENSSVIAKLTQKAIMTGAPDFALKRIKDITYDTSKGHNPRWVRVWTTPPTRSAYGPLLGSGNQNYSVQNPQTGAMETVSGDKVGRGCSIPADTMQYGYDVKTRCLQGRAIELGPWCVLDLIEKEAWQAVIQRVWTDAPKYAKEQFGRQLRLDVIKYSKHKFSVREGFPMSTDTPYFPCVPTGGPSVGFIRQIADQIRPWGWNEGAGTPVIEGVPAFQVQMGRNAIEWAIEQRKAEKGFKVETTRTADDKTFGETLVYEGIQFIADETPTRGYLREVGTDTYEFVEIDPYLVVPADGEGFKPIPNPSYYRTHITVDGARYRVLEVGYFIHPDAMVRESMGTIPSAPGGKSFKAKFDFSVQPIPDWELAAKGCNKDLFFFGYRMLHAYAPRPVNPELMGAFLYVAPIPQYTIVDPWSDETEAASEPVTPAALPAQPANSCEPCERPGATEREIPIPTCSDLFPENGVGVIRFRQSAYDVSELASALTIVVERLGGNDGAASCVITLTEGTATEPENFEAPAGFAGAGPFTKTLNWADGEAGIKTVVVPIVEAGGDDSGKQFTATLGTFSGAAAGSITTATVTILDDDEA